MIHQSSFIQVTRTAKALLKWPLLLHTSKSLLGGRGKTGFTERYLHCDWLKTSYSANEVTFCKHASRTPMLSLIVMQPSWTTVPCPTTKLGLLISKSFVGIKQSVISVALTTPIKTRLGICIYKTSLPHQPDNYTVHPRFSGPRLTGRVQQGGTFNYLV